MDNSNIKLPLRHTLSKNGSNKIVKLGVFIFIVLVCLTHFYFYHKNGEKLLQQLLPEFIKEQQLTLFESTAIQLKKNDLVLYTNINCRDCTNAKIWLGRHNYQFTECNISNSKRCNLEFNAFGEKALPYLLIKGVPINKSGGFNEKDMLKTLEKFDQNTQLDRLMGR